MKRIITCLLCLLPALSAHANSKLIAETDPRSPWEQQALFHLPEGFEIQLVASEPTIGQPMNLNFDVHGRLWVTHTLEYPYPAKDPKQARDQLTLFSGIGRDGRPTSHTNFLEHLNIPIGVIPLGAGDTAIVHSVPDIHLAVPGHKEKLYGSIGQQDTHGMVNSFTQWLDGWIYGCHGFRNSSSITDGSGKTTKLQSGNTYRFKPDGSTFEQWTWGQVNPFGLTFDEWGNIFTADCHSKPLTQLLRGATYQSFGKPHDGLGFGPDMIDHTHGSTGICGPAYYQATDYPEEYRGTLFLCNPVNGIVHWDKLKREGSTLLVDSQPDFITCDDPWFRPVDAIMGPDGALYIADFYNAIIGHYEVRLDHPKRDRAHGRVWRVVHKDGAHALPNIPSNAKNEINSNNLFVRTLATNYLVHQQETNLPTTATNHRLVGMWVKERVHGLSDDELTAIHQKETLPVFITHLYKLIGNRDTLSDTARAMLREGLDQQNPFARRAAIEALGVHPRLDQVSDLTRALRICHWAKNRKTAPTDLPEADKILAVHTDKDDTHLRHAIRIALRNHLRLPNAFDALEPDKELADIALAIKQPHAGKFLMQYLRSQAFDAGQAKYFTHLAQSASETNLIPFIAHFEAENIDIQLQVLSAIQDGLDKQGRKNSPVTRNPAQEALRTAVLAPQPDIPNLCQLIERFKLSDESERLATWLRDDSLPADQRKRCATALLVLTPHNRLSALLKHRADPLVYEAIISRDESAIQSLLEAAMTHGNSAQQTTLAQNLINDKAGAEALLELVSSGKASPRLLNQANIKSRMNSYKLQQRASALTKELPPVSKEISSLIQKRRAGYAQAKPDVEAGLALFAQHCGICHKVKNEGGSIGPHLDGIGARGLDRLLEDVLDPNRNIDQHFRTTIIKTAQGLTHSGLLLRKEGALTLLGDPAGNEISIPSAEITEETQTGLSPMPPAFGTLIPEAEFYHLMAYLLSL